MVVVVMVIALGADGQGHWRQITGTNGTSGTPQAVSNMGNNNITNRVMDQSPLPHPPRWRADG